MSRDMETDRYGLTNSEENPSPHPSHSHVSTLALLALNGSLHLSLSQVSISSNLEAMVKQEIKLGSKDNITVQWDGCPS
jgi:hypothetical protein